MSKPQKQLNIKHWLEDLLTPRQRKIVKGRFGLFGKRESFTQIAEQLEVPEERVRQQERSALRILKDNQQRLALLFAELDAALARHGGALHVEELDKLPTLEDVHAEGLHSAGLLYLFAQLRDDWRYYQLNGGILVKFNKREESKPTAAASRVVDTAVPTPSNVDALAKEPSPPKRRRRTVREAGPLWSLRPQRSSAPAINTRSPLYPLELELRQRLHQVELIGELAVERARFEEWCRLVRKEATRAGKLHLKLVPQALFVTLMVFTARYSEEEERTFWQPYARMVWDLDEASQHFQNQCRDYFRQAITFLTDEYDLAFPQRSAGDLVRPIYRHAIIPAYLEPIFVSWLKSHWEEVLEVPPDYLVAHLQQERSLRYLPPTLYRFINEPDTADAAADLIRNMAFAASLYEEGKSLVFIRDLLADSPIERSLWDEFAVIFAVGGEQANRRPRARLEWVWSLETTEMLLRLRNVTLVSDVAPDLAVWTSPDTPTERLTFTDVYARLDPWQLAENEWLIDELLFAPDGPLDGKIVLLGGDDSVLWEQQVPPLPTGPARFFRISQQKVYVLPVDSSSVQASRYVLACSEDVTLNGNKAEALLDQEPLTLPYLIKDHFAVAGIYTIDPPLEIRHQGQKVAELAPTSANLTADPSYISGQKPVPGLSPRVPPAFRDRDIWLVIPGATNRILERTTLWLRSQSGAFQHCLLHELDVEVDEDAAFWVPLRPFLADVGGYYTVELRQGLRALLPAPLEFLHVPGLEIMPPPERPEESPVYTPVHLPSARVKGITLEQIGNPAQVEAVVAEDGWLDISWRDVRGECRLLLRVNEQSIPLAWPIKRFSAWVEPAPYEGIFEAEDLEEVVFRASGSHDIVNFFFVNIAGDEHKQRIELNAQGQFSSPLRHHGLRDMIRHSPGERVQVNVSVFGHTWRLLVVRRKSDREPPGSPSQLAKVEEVTSVADDLESARLSTSPTFSQVSHDEFAEPIISVKRAGELSAQRLWRLASVPAPILVQYDGEKLTRVWSLLEQLRAAHDVADWEDRYGLLPAWAIVSRPLRLTFNRGATIVYPEVASRQGRRGIGYSNLNFIHSWSRVYVAWEPSSTDNEFVRVRFGVLPADWSGRYQAVDEWDLEPVFQCKSCGHFLSYGQLRAGRHAHAGERYLATVDVLNTTSENPFLATVTSSGRGARMRHTESPEEIIDPDIVVDGVSSYRGYEISFNKVSNPMTVAAHRSACSAWLRRYWDDSGSRWHLQRLLSGVKWQRAANNLERYLMVGAPDVPPAYAAVGRFLSAFNTRGEKSIKNLDRDLLLLALLARHMAHDPASAVAVRRQVCADERSLSKVLHDAQAYAPELLQWAFTWVELFFIHSLT